MSLVLSQLRWPSLAQDLAVMTVPGSPIPDLSQIYLTYGLTKDELVGILHIPAFQNMLEEELDKCKAQGKSAGVQYRFSALSQSLSEKLFRDATAPGKMEYKDAIKLLELYMKAAKMLVDKEPAQVNTQVNVGVQLPLPVGITNPKLKHLTPTEALDAPVQNVANG